MLWRLECREQMGCRQLEQMAKLMMEVMRLNAKLLKGLKECRARGGPPRIRRWVIFYSSMVSLFFFPFSWSFFRTYYYILATVVRWYKTLLGVFCPNDDHLDVINPAIGGALAARWRAESLWCCAKSGLRCVEEFGSLKTRWRQKEWLCHRLKAIECGRRVMTSHDVESRKS